jgi:hypothetical protein
MGELFVSLIVGLILYQIINVIVCIPGMTLIKKFNEIGNMKGKTLEEISKVCGKPNSTHYGYGYILCQWHDTGYHIALKFDNNKNFISITSEICSIK